MYGVIDIGSNTIRLSVYEIENNQIMPIFHKKSVVGLGGCVDGKGNLSKKGIDRAVEALKEFGGIIDTVGLEDVYTFATASLRNIENTGEAVKTIQKKCGLSICVLSGENEALYSYYGATLLSPASEGILVDLGGGSTEFVFYQDNEIKKAFSLPLGSLNLYAKYVSRLLPTVQETKTICDAVLCELSAAVGPGAMGLEKRKICGVGGTVRGTRKLLTDVFGHYTENAYKQIETKKMKEFLNISSGDNIYTIEKIIEVIPDRIHTIIPGMLMLNTVAEYFESEIIGVSDYGVREGYLYHMLTDDGVIHV